MKKNRILLFAGTTEGRKLSEYLAAYPVRTHVCVATEYGEDLLPEGENLTVSHKRLNAQEMAAFIGEFAPDFVIDATHPYADEVTANIKKACEQTGMEYLRVVRAENKASSDCVFVDSIEEAVAFLQTTKGNILAATGSKELAAYTKIPDYGKRVFARVLSTAEVVGKCEALGFVGRNLICMQGPFSVEMNVAMMKQFDIAYLVTKESGKAGGFPEKCEAAKRAGAALVVIGRPEKETGYSLEEMYTLLGERLGGSGKKESVKCCEALRCPERQVALVGIGMGSALDMTLRVRKICENAQLIIGAKRMAEAVASRGQAVFESYKPQEIVSYIKEHIEYEKIAVVFSGDVGFYSGAKKLYEALTWERENGVSLEITVEPGISSVAYFCAKLGVSWEDARLLSLHGKQDNLIAAVRDHKKILALTGNAESVRAIGEKLTEYGYGDLQVALGEELSYPSEKITKGMARKLCAYEGGSLSVLYIENPDGGKRQVTGGICDREFLRGEVPMTKEEVRSVSLAKLGLKKDSVVYDIGAGTGSVSVEAALLSSEGHVYAIERKKEAAELIEKNKRQFGTENLTVIEGSAPDALGSLPIPDCVFIGGSGGHLREIVQKILETALKDRQPEACGQIRFVLNAISLDTVSEAMSVLAELKKDERFSVENEEIAQISVAKSKSVGGHHMMMGQNPIYVMSFLAGRRE